MGRFSVKFLAQVTVVALCMTIFASAAFAKKTVTVWSGYPELQPIYEAAKADFEKANPDIEVKLEFFPLQGFIEKMNVVMPSGNGPDVAELITSWAYNFIDAGLFQENPANIVKDINKNVLPAYRPSTQWGKKSIGVPVCYYSELLFWNKKMFSEAGLGHAPVNYDELTSYAKKLTKYDASGNLTRSGFSLRIMGAPSGTMEKFWATALIPNNMDVVKAKGKNKYDIGFTPKAAEWGLKFYIDMLYKHNVDNFLVKHDSEAFALGQTAMFEREQWVTGYLKQNAPTLEYGIAHLPKYKSQGTFVKARALYVSKSSKVRNDAWKFVEFFFSPKYQGMMVSQTGWLSTRQDLNYNELLKNTPQLLNVMTYPKSMKLHWDAMTPAYDECHVKGAEVLLKAFRDKSLADNPKGISKVISDMVNSIRTVLRNYGQY
jgi:multiple sugar transport system substrate-binding protein